MELKRLARVAFFTFSMYVVTHIIVFSVLPIGIMVMTLDRKRSYQNKAYEYKVRFADWLLKIIRKSVSVSGLRHYEKGKDYLIVANYPSFYTGFLLMKLFPKALIVVHAFMSKMPVLGNLLKQVGAIFVDSKGPKSTKQAIDRMLKQYAMAPAIIHRTVCRLTPNLK